MRHARTHLTMIDVRLQQGLFNNKCFNNAVQYVHDRPKNKNLSVVEVMCIDRDQYPFLHYVVHDSKEKVDAIC